MKNSITPTFAWLKLEVKSEELRVKNLNYLYSEKAVNAYKLQYKLKFFTLNSSLFTLVWQHSEHIGELVDTLFQFLANHHLHHHVEIGFEGEAHL